MGSGWHDHVGRSTPPPGGLVQHRCERDGACLPRTAQDAKQAHPGETDVTHNILRTSIRTAAGSEPDVNLVKVERGARRQIMAVLKARRGAPLSSLAQWSLILSGVFFLYTCTYLATAALPGNPEAPLGWWGWYDQGGYIASARAFADGTWRTVEHLYPPLYPWLGSYFIDVWPDHPFFLVDFGGLAIYVVALVAIGRRIFGRLATWCAVTGSFLLFPALTTQQWTTPWTTSLSSGIGASMLLVLARFAGRRWTVASPFDWFLVGLYSLSIGAIGAVRPLDFIVWLPAALTFYFGILRTSANPWRPGFAIRRALLLGAIVVTAGLLVPALYVGFNYATSGTFLGTYIIRNSVNGYQVHGLVRKFVSLFFDSSTVYVEPDQAIADRFWPLYLAFPLIVYYLVKGPLILRVLCITIATQFLLYVPYADLLPNGVFRYGNIHYFTWTLPWLSMFGLGFVRSIVGAGAPRSRRTTAEIAMVATCTVLCFLVTLRAGPVGTATATTSSAHGITAELNAPQGVDFVDIVGATGSWPDVYFGANTLEIDGRPYRMVAEFRLVPTEQGLRVILPRTVLAQRFALTLDPGIRIEPAIVAARASGVSVSFSCRVTAACSTTPLTAPLPFITTTTTVEFADGEMSAPYLVDGWYQAEDWGRWSTAPKADLAFHVDHPRAVPIEATVQPLVSPARPVQTITIKANACPVGEATFTLPSDAAPKTIVGEIPASCIAADGNIDLALSTDDAPTPKAIGIGEDGRTIGLGIQRLKID